MELKNVTLLNLWKARQGSPNANPNEYKPLLDYLYEAKEEDLLKLNFSFYHKGLRKWGCSNTKHLY
jgi:hypothetical protein